MSVVKPLFHKYTQMHHGIRYMGMEIGYIHRHMHNGHRFFFVKVRKPGGEYHTFTSLSLREVKADLSVSIINWYQGMKPMHGLAPDEAPRRVLYDPETRAKMLSNARARLLGVAPDDIISGWPDEEEWDTGTPILDTEDYDLSEVIARDD